MAISTGWGRCCWRRGVCARTGRIAHIHTAYIRGLLNFFVAPGVISCTVCRKKTSAGTFTRRHAGRPLRRHTGLPRPRSGPSLTLGTSRSAVDDMVRSPKPTPTFAALAVAAGRQLHLYSSPHMHKHTRPHACTRPRPPPYNPPPPHGVTPPHGVRAPTKGNDHSTPNTEHNIMPKAPINTPKSPNLPTLDKTARTKPNHATS